MEEQFAIMMIMLTSQIHQLGIATGVVVLVRSREEIGATNQQDSANHVEEEFASGDHFPFIFIILNKQNFRFILLSGRIF